MNKIKIPKNWRFKYFEVEDNNTKFVYEDQFGIEHIYIDEEPQPELPTYEELQKRLDFMIEQNDKKQQVLDKIKEYIKEDKNCVPKHISDYILKLFGDK